MTALLEDNGFWIAAGSVLFGVVLWIARRIHKGEEPQQFGDEVK